MTSHNLRGFTIIELLLFLGITGLMFVGLMAGVSTNINQQRYRDSVNTFASLVQQQYSAVINTRNDRDGSWHCDASVVSQDAIHGQARGTTDCVVLGRYIRTTDNGSKVETGDVVGTEPSLLTTLQSDQAALTAYVPKVSGFGQEIVNPEWGAVLRDTNKQAANFSILILRSPLSGLLRVFAMNSPLPSQLTDMINKTNATTNLTVCVVADGWSLGPTQAIVVNAATAGPSGVAIKGDSNGC